MTVVDVPVSSTDALVDEASSGHNRWHPDIAPRVSCAPGDTVLVSTRDAADGQLTSESTVDELFKLDIGRVHPLTGPIRVEGAERGDLLELQIEEVTPAPFGFTAVLPGLGFLRDLFDEPYLVRWELDGAVAVSEEIPGIRIPAEPFLGIIGVAPDARLLSTSRDAEEDTLRRDGRATPPIDAASAIPGGRVGAEGLRTLPPRANGGNIDVKQNGPGSAVFLPVLVPGANFSIGDAHFAQGDGEVCGLAIETRSTTRLRVELHPGEARRRGIHQMQILRNRTGLGAGNERACFVTTGLSLTEPGANCPEDTTLAARNALLDMISYLQHRGLSRVQAYALCSVAVDLRISQLVDVPNVTVSASLPLDIFT